MDLVITVLALLAAAIFLVVVAAGALRPASRAGARRAPSSPVQEELDDLEQLQAAVNAKRRARGAPELTTEDLDRFSEAGSSDDRVLRP